MRQMTPFGGGVLPSCRATHPRCRLLGGPTSIVGPMKDITVAEQSERLSQGRDAGQLVGRELEMERIHAFLDAARTDGGTLLVTGEPGVGKTVSWTLQLKRRRLLGMRILWTAGV